jgi:hypothetical protein
LHALDPVISTFSTLTGSWLDCAINGVAIIATDMQ